MKLRFKKLFLSTIAFVAIIGSFEAQAMQNEEGPQKVRKRGKFRAAQQRKANISLENIQDDPDLPSRFIRDNKASLPYNVFHEEDRIAYLDNSKGLFDKYTPLWDACFLKAKDGNLQAAEWLSTFYQSLTFSPGPLWSGLTKEEAEKNIVRSYDIAKKFAKMVAVGGGSPKEYIHLTGLGYAAKRADHGKEMKECTKWMIKDFLKYPYDPKAPNHFFAIINSDYWKPCDIDKKSLASLENYIASSYHKRHEARIVKALMLLKGFFGEAENNNERAFRIIVQECLRIGSVAPSMPSPDGTIIPYLHSARGNILGTSGTLFLALAKKQGYDPEKDHRLCRLGISDHPLQIIQESTGLLQYYKIVPEQIAQQLPKKKKTLYLDLHGKNKGKSAEEVIQFLNYMTQDKNIKHSIIITGKGNHSPGHTPILKPFVQNMLEEIAKDNVFSIKYQEDSGEGAFRVWLQS